MESDLVYRRKTDIFLGVPYEKGNSPHVLLDPGFDPLTGKINCQTFGHIYLREEFGVFLSSAMWSQEIYHDNGIYFRHVENGERIFRGDVFLFGREGTDPKDLHIAVVHRPHHDPRKFIIRHANQEDNMVSDWSLSEALNYPRYSVIHGVRRVIPDIFSTTIAPVIIFE